MSNPREELKPGIFVRSKSHLENHKNALRCRNPQSVLILMDIWSIWLKTVVKDSQGKPYP